MEKLLTEISNWCEKENMPSHWTINELLEGAKLSRSQRKQLILFQKQLELQVIIQEQNAHKQMTPVSSERIEWYKNEINRLKEVDKQTTLSVQRQLNIMDQLDTIAQKPHVIFDLDETDEGEGEFLHGARLRESGISHDEYENGDQYDQGDSSHDAHYN